MEPLISVSSFDFHLACFASQSRGDSFLLIEIIDRTQTGSTNSRAMSSLTSEATQSSFLDALSVLHAFYLIGITST